MQLVTCTKKKGTKKAKCTTKVVTGTVQFTTTGKPKTLAATLTRHGTNYTAKLRLSKNTVHIATKQKLPAGRYRILIAGTRSGHLTIR